MCEQSYVYGYHCPKCGSSDFSIESTLENGEHICCCEECKHIEHETHFQHIYKQYNIAYWNYRRMFYSVEYNEHCFVITEVYYDDNDMPVMHTIDHNDSSVPASATAHGETPEELKQCFDMMDHAFVLPVLLYKDGKYSIWSEVDIT